MNLNQSIISIFLICVFASCQTEIDQANSAKDYATNELDNSSRYYHKQYQTYTLEGCEYIVVDIGAAKWGSHKGNCKNPIHEWNKK